MTRRTGFRKSLRDTLAANNAADRYYAAMAGVEPQAQSVIAPKRAYTKSAPEELEGATLRAVGDLLAVHPRVLLAVRQNGGAMEYRGAGGRPVPVWFYRIIREPRDVKVRIADYWGFLTDMRPFAVECKRRNWTAPHGEREQSQAAFLGMIRALGGIGIFATDAQQVADALAAA